MNVRRTVAIAASTLALAAIAAPASAVRPVVPDWHNPAFWGDDCYKVEYGGGMYMPPAGTSWTLIKAGTDYYFNTGYFTGTTKEISFVIYCPGYQS